MLSGDSQNMQELDLQWICKQYDKCATVGCVRQAAACPCSCKNCLSNASECIGLLTTELSHTMDRMLCNTAWHPVVW